MESRRVNKGSWWWRDLQKMELGARDLFDDNVRLRVGDGGNTLFWHDKWVTEERPLKSKYGRLFGMSVQGNHLVKDMGD